MYGLVNKAIKDFVLVHYGNEVWETTFKELELSETYFLSMENNPDHVTYEMLSHVCLKAGYTSSELAEQIGEYFLSYAGKEGFEDLLELAGDNLPDLLQNLNDLHFRRRKMHYFNFMGLS